MQSKRKQFQISVCTQFKLIFPYNFLNLSVFFSLFAFLHCMINDSSNYLDASDFICEELESIKFTFEFYTFQQAPDQVVVHELKITQHDFPVKPCFCPACSSQTEELSHLSLSLITSTYLTQHTLSLSLMCAACESTLVMSLLC